MPKSSLPSDTMSTEAGRAAQRAAARIRSPYFTSKRIVAADPMFEAGYTRVLDAGRPLLLAAQASGETRSALTVEQILDMVAAIAKIPGDTSYREPILQAVLDALRPINDA
jgi:hypothetical protein